MELKVRDYRIFAGKKSKEKTSELSVILASPEERQKMWSKLEERVTEKIPAEKIAKLIRVDGLTFRAIQEHIDFIVRPDFILIGEKDIVEQLTLWKERIKLLTYVEKVVRSIFRTGNGWLELGFTDDIKDITQLRLIPDEYIDYIRNKQTNIVKLDKKGNPLGFRQSKDWLGHTVSWTEKNIKVGGKIVYTAKAGEDCRDRIAHFILFDQEESYLGYTPSASAYKTAIVRLNLEDAVGEGAFRSEGLVIKVKGPEEGILATDEQLRNVAKDFGAVTYNNIITTKQDIEVSKLPGPDLVNKLELIYGLADLQCCAMGIPLPLILDPRGRGYRGDIEDKGVRFELRERALQARLGEQLLDKLIKRLMKARRMDLSKLPKISFNSWMPQSKLVTARNRGIYARRGLIKWDPELELRLRKEENLPTKFVQSQLDAWVKRNKNKWTPLPEIKPAVDKKEIENMLEDFLEERLSEYRKKYES